MIFFILLNVTDNTLSPGLIDDVIIYYQSLSLGPKGSLASNMYDLSSNSKKDDLKSSFKTLSNL